MKNIALLALIFCLPAYGSEFTISGLKIGDRVENKDYLGICPMTENAQQPECLSIFEMAGGEVLVTYYFEGQTFTGASIIFDSKKFSNLVKFYNQQLGKEPEIRKEAIEIGGEKLTNKIAVWKIGDKEFIVQKYKSYKRGLAYLKA